MTQGELFDFENRTQKPRFSGWWSKKPGWWRAEAKRDSKRLTDQQFLNRYCHHHSTFDDACRGHQHKDWSKVG